MIEILLDHSYEDDYFMISEVRVNIKDASEKDRIDKIVKEHNVEGALVDPDRDLTNRIARLLQVEPSIIDLDTNEIDLM